MIQRSGYLPRVHVKPARRRSPSWFAAAFLIAISMHLLMAPGALGLSLGLQWNGNPEQSVSESQLDVVQHSGAVYYRMLVSRTTVIEKGWSFYDGLFDGAAKRGITILPYLFEGNGPYPAPPYGGWGSWVREVAQRYGPSSSFWAGKSYARPVTTWEIWNEPNLQEYNPGGIVDPVAYGNFFVFTSGEIHAVQPGAQVLVGGLYLGGWSEPAMESYVSELYKATGMASAVGGVAIHPYGFTQGWQFAEFANETINIRTVLNRHPQGSSKPLWITELGWPVGAKGEFSGRAVDAPTQAELLRLSFNWAKSEASSLNIQGLIWNEVSDINVNTWDYHCGLRDLAGNYRESWWTFQQQAGAPIWPVWEAWPSDNLGGTLASDPTISSQGPGQLDVFARGTDNALWHKWYSGGGWSGWQSLGGNITSGPGAVSWGSNRIDVVARGGDNAVWHWAWNGSGWSVESLGGSIVGDPEVSSQGPGQLDVFARGTDNALWHKWYSGGGWSGWQSLGGNITSGPGAVSWGSNRIDVVARGGDNAVWHWAWNGSGWSVESLGGSVSSDPDVSTLGPGYLDLFVRAGNNELWYRSFSGVWGPWQDLGGVLTSGPGAVSWSNVRTDVVDLASNASVNHSFWNP